MSDPSNAPKPTQGPRRLATGEQHTMLAAPAVPTDEHDWAGREVAGRYRVLDRIGEGGMGVVYVAEHVQLRKKVAFKVIHPELAVHEDLLLRFQREALATGQLDHPHIAAAIDFDQLEDGSAFIVMPWVRGHSLQAELDSSGPMDIKRACRLGAQIADALSAAHAVGIVHRDLKPDNVLIETRSDGSESCKVLDFGVASLTGRAERLSVETSRPLTQAGTVLGTPGYMSPEQATAGDVDHRTDLYALGVILWELCRGERLFDGDDVTQIFAKQFNSIPPALGLGGSRAATELSQLVARLLSWNKLERPESASEVRDALRRLAETAGEGPSLSVSVPLPQVKDLRRFGPMLGGTLLLLAIFAWVASDDDETAVTPDDIAAEQVDTARAKAQGKPPAKAQGKPPARGSEAKPSKLGSELGDAIDDVISSANRAKRREAARLIDKNPGKAPRYAELSAQLELASRCKDKEKLVVEMRELGDPRVLPSLERLSSTPRRGCGLIRLNDCLACVRGELSEAISALEAAQ